MALITTYWTADVLFILTTVLVGIYFYLTRHFNYWRKRGVREAAPTAIFGNFAPVLLAQKSVIDVFQDLYKAGADEPYLGFYVLDRPFLLLRDPELIKCVLIKDFNYFCDRNGSSKDTDMVGKMNLFFGKNPHWRFFRHKLSPVFTTGRLKKMFELMLEIDDDFEVYLNNLNLQGAGRDLEIKEICAKFTTDMIGLTAYGIRFNSLLDPEAMVRRVGRDIFGRTYKRHVEFISSFLIPSLVKIFGFHSLGKATSEFLRNIFWEAIDERIKTGTKRGDLIDLLVDIKQTQEKDEHVEQKWDGDTLAAQAAVFFTGGFETSSSTMTFALYELARHPEIQDKLREELTEELNRSSGRITYEMLTSSLPYLDMVVSETLRMYPILPFLDRYTEMDYQFPGTKLTVRAGTPIVIPMRAIQMDPKYFVKPEVFDPERFSIENKRNIKSNTYFPFGDGPRVCIGTRLGLLQTKLGLTHLISKYEFSQCKKTIPRIEFDNLSVLIATRESIVLNVKRLADSN